MSGAWRETAWPTRPRPRAQHRAPRFAMPAGATDCHMHVFGPGDRFPYATPRNYTPEDATLAQYQAFCAQIGLERVVFVQASVYGHDNRALLAAMAEHGPSRSRAVASVPADVTDAELQRLHDAGCRGARLFFGETGADALARARRDFAALEARLAGSGWHIDLLSWLPVIDALAPELASSRVPLVFDHLGRPDGEAGLGQPGFARLLALMDEGMHWTKLSGPYRLASSIERGLAFFSTFLLRYPQRVVWGSDWPHPGWHGGHGRAAEGFSFDVDGGDLLNLLADAGADEALRQRVLVENPARLYGF